MLIPLFVFLLHTLAGTYQSRALAFTADYCYDGLEYYTCTGTGNLRPCNGGWIGWPFAYRVCPDGCNDNILIFTKTDGGGTLYTPSVPGTCAERGMVEKQVYWNENSRKLNQCFATFPGFYHIASNAVGSLPALPFDPALFTPGCYSSIPADLEQGIDDKEPCPQNDDSPNKTPQYLGNPINILSGNKYESATDLQLPTPNRQQIRFSRAYNSQSILGGPLGYGWTHSYAANLTFVTLDGIDHIRIEDRSGRGHYFELGADNQWNGVFKEKSFVTAETDGTFTWHKTDGTGYGFDAQGFLIWLKDEVGNQQTFTYDASNRLASLTDQASGRSLNFTYNASGLLETITGLLTPAVADGVWVTYGYDADSNLTSVTYADGSGFDYEYDGFHHLTAKKDKLGHVLTTWTYDAQGRANGSMGRNPEETVAINYDNYETGGTIDVSDSYGVTHTYAITRINDFYPRITDITGPGGCTSCAGEKPVHYVYDDQLNVTEEEYANGAIKRFLNYDASGNPGTVVLAAGTPEERTIHYTYHPETGERMTRIESSVLGAGNKETIWDFDDDYNDIPNENPTSLVSRLVEKGYTRDNSGAVVAYGYVTTYHYNTRGQLISVDGPASGSADTTTFSYDPNTGDLLTVTRPAVGAVTFGNYDEAGNLGIMTDVNNQQTVFTYDGRNRQLSSTINGIQHSRSFNLAGDLEAITDPAGRALRYSYYGSGRLHRITDMPGNALSYGYDAQGSLTEDYTYDSTGVKKRWLNYDYNNPADPGRLWRVLYPDGGAIHYLYDNVGNISSVTDPLNRTTSYQYDALNQLRQIDQPGPTVTKYDDYDSQGNLKTVTDATLKSTGYEYDDMGRMLKADSPDAGMISYVHDTVNNRMYSTDANGLTTTYIFDDIGRLTGVTFSDGSPTETVGYDDNTYGMGRLTAFTDSAGGTEFFYNSLGQLIQETRTNSGMTSLATVYGYNSTNADLDSLTYPSGLVVSYGRDSNGRINAILADSAPLIGSISHMPFGPAEDYDMMAGGAVLLHVDRTFNERYLPTRIQAGTVMDYQYKYYADGSVWQISGVPTTTVNQEVTDSYQVAGTNQLDYSVTNANPPVQYGYDANGNTITDGSRTFAYDRHNRLVSITQGAETLAEYAYDFQGRRVKKTVGGMTTSYVYDAANNLIAEIAGDGTPLRDYIYLGSEPVAMKVYGTQAGIYYFINDHLGTPQKIVDSNGAMVWEAAYLPFGQAQELLATITNNLRFPGQYFDVETGLHYNWLRYYDPSTGRYMTPDPIGLAGGINLYRYAGANPVNYIDPYGLSYMEAAIPIATVVSQLDTALPGPMDVVAGAIIGAAWLADNPPVWNEGNDGGEQCDAPPDYPDDPSSPPGPDWEWRGGEMGSWFKKDPKQSYRPHPDGPNNPHGEHYDWKTPNGKWRHYPDGRLEPK